MVGNPKILVIGMGPNYIEYLKKLAGYTDLSEITVFDKISGYEYLFNGFRILPPLNKLKNTDSILYFDCCFITPGTPLAIKNNLLSMDFPESKIYTELESVLRYIKMPAKLRNIGLMKYDKEAIGDNKISLDVNSLNDLEAYVLANNDRRQILRWMHYFEVYERHFAKFRNTAVTLVEIGVFNGGSLQMWKNYFGGKCRIIGVDIDPKCKEFEENQIEIMIGSQEDRSFLRKLAENLSQIDILIDDGGHTMNQQITTFEELFPLISENGVYLCEDLHTSYWPKYGGRYKKPGTFIEYSKEFIDYLNAWHFKELEKDAQAQNFKHSAHSLHYYDSILVVEKRKMYSPTDIFS